MKTAQFARTDLQSRLIAGVTGAMAARGITQRALAPMAGMTEKHLSQILTGRIFGTLATWERLLAATGVAVEIMPPDGES